MTDKESIKDLESQARNTRYLVDRINRAHYGRPRKKVGRPILIGVSFCVALVCMASDSIPLLLIALGALGLVAILSEGR